MHVLNKRVTGGGGEETKRTPRQIGYYSDSLPSPWKLIFLSVIAYPRDHCPDSRPGSRLSCQAGVSEIEQDEQDDDTKWCGIEVMSIQS